MISIIICSTHNDIPDVLKENIKDSIGVPYELVIIDNSKNEYSIFEAYNLGVKHSSYPYLCFIHEDILFRSRDWGKALSEAFQHDEKVGLIGVIGTTFLPYLPLGWWASGIVVGSIVQSDKSKKMVCDSEYLTSEKNSITDAVACDGLFLAMPRFIFGLISFDSTTFDGFHCYDLDICMQVINSGYKVAVSENIIIEHFSVGNPDYRFVTALSVFNKKWEKILPCACEGISEDEIVKCNNNWLKILLNNRRYVYYNEGMLNSRSMKYFKYLFNATGTIRKLIRDRFHL